MTQEPLTDRQLAIIRGSLLGDMSMRRQRATPNLLLRHSTKDAAYMEWFRHELPELFVRAPRVYRTLIGSTEYKVLAMDSRVHSDLAPVWDVLYRNGSKTLTEEFLSVLNPLAIAVWYMDDGCLYLNRGRGGKAYPNVTLSTQAFTKSENELIRSYFAERFGILWNLSTEHRRGHELYHLQLGKRAAVERFMSLVRPHVIPHFHRKLT